MVNLYYVNMQGLTIVLPPSLPGLFCEIKMVGKGEPRVLTPTQELYSNKFFQIVE